MRAGTPASDKQSMLHQAKALCMTDLVTATSAAMPTQDRTNCVGSNALAGMQGQKIELAKGGDVAAAQKKVVYQLQLLGCTFRRALRKGGKRIIAGLSASGEGCPLDADEHAAAARICSLMKAADAAIYTVQKVRSDLMQPKSAC